MKKSSEGTLQKITAPLYYLTNQYNLREILTGGFIGPLNSFGDKYYPDLLELTPGRIPLFAGAVSNELVSIVNSHDPVTSYAVILEISALSASVGELMVFSSPDQETAAAFVYTGLISVKDVSAIHFLSGEKLNEFTARSYRNMHDAKNLYRVSPELCSQDTTGRAAVQWFGTLPAVETPSKQKFNEVDKLSGAVVLAIHHSSGRDQSKQFLSLLETGKRSKKTDSIPYWFSRVFDLQNNDLDFGDINEIVFRTTSDVLMSYDWSTIKQKTKVLSHIKHAVYASQLNAEQSDILERSFQKMEKLLKLQDDFKPFNATPGQDAIRGLLLFLMRPEPKDLISWKPEDTNASHNAMLTALAFAGLVNGRKGLDTLYKPGKVDQEVAELAMGRIMYVTEKKTPGRKTAARDKSKKTAIESSSETIISDSPVTPALQQLKADSFSREELKVRIDSTGLSDPEVIQAAISYCRNAGWDHCISTTVRTDNKTYSIQSNDEGLTFHLQGFPEVITELNSEEFIRMLSK